MRRDLPLRTGPRGTARPAGMRCVPVSAPAAGGSCRPGLRRTAATCMTPPRSPGIPPQWLAGVALVQQLRHTDRAQRRAGRFGDHRVTHRHGRSDLFGQQGQRQVPQDDGADHTERPTNTRPIAFWPGMGTVRSRTRHEARVDVDIVGWLSVRPRSSRRESDCPALDQQLGHIAQGWCARAGTPHQDRRHWCGGIAAQAVNAASASSNRELNKAGGPAPVSQIRRGRRGAVSCAP
jgi:hypothetical protein